LQNISNINFKDFFLKKKAMNPTTVVAKPSTISAGTTEIPSKDGTGACSIM
ncbi:4547_t:CDS:1, partial [Funneliformis geosporum]